MNKAVASLIESGSEGVVYNFAQAGAAWALFSEVVSSLADDPAVLEVAPGIKGLSLLANVLNSAPVLDMDKDQVEALGAVVSITLAHVFFAQNKQE